MREEHSRIEEENGGELIVVHMHGSIGDDNTLKAQLLNAASHAHNGCVKQVLIKNENLGHNVGSEFKNWAEASIERPLLAAGIDKIAIVTPDNDKAFALIHTTDSVRKRYFNTETEARKWLG